MASEKKDTTKDDFAAAWLAEHADELPPEEPARIRAVELEDERHVSTEVPVLPARVNPGDAPRGFRFDRQIGAMVLETPWWVPADPIGADATEEQTRFYEERTAEMRRWAAFADRVAAALNGISKSLPIRRGPEMLVAWAPPGLQELEALAAVLCPPAWERKLQELLRQTALYGYHEARSRAAVRNPGESWWPNRIRKSGTDVLASISRSWGEPPDKLELPPLGVTAELLEQIIPLVRLKAGGGGAITPARAVELVKLGATDRKKLRQELEALTKKRKQRKERRKGKRRHPQK
jgi:hypothetical protein